MRTPRKQQRLHYGIVLAPGVYKNTKKCLLTFRIFHEYFPLCGRKVLRCKAPSDDGNDLSATANHGGIGRAHRFLIGRSYVIGRGHFVLDPSDHRGC